eukprot:3452944-Prymnesium_polylepis.1
MSTCKQPASEVTSAPRPTGSSGVAAAMTDLAMPTRCTLAKSGRVHPTGRVGGPLDGGTTPQCN